MDEENVQNVQEAPQEEPVEQPQSENETIVNGLLNNEIKIEDLDNAYQNGELSEEDYNDIMTQYENAVNQPQEPEQPQESTDQPDMSNITDEELETMLQNGEIDQETYDSIISGRDDEQVPEEPQEEPSPIVGKFNLIKLFDKFILLKKYINIHLECYDDIEPDELTKMQTIAIYKIIRRIKELKENLSFYIDNNFSTEDYKKNLYVYLLFNKSFAEELKKFRNVLHLNPDKIIKERENAELKKKK